MRFRINGTGCSLLDNLYTRVDFRSPGFTAYLSRSPGDGGLVTGGLTFAEDLSRFAGRPYPDILRDIVGERPPDAMNLGGPAVVALIHAAQMLEGTDTQVEFHGIRGDDEAGALIAGILDRTPIGYSGYRTGAGLTPFTDVFSDPGYHDGAGERTFVNYIGFAAGFTPESLDPSFFDAEMLLFGGTALMPGIHDNLTGLLEKGRKNGSITVVNTVFDFRNERTHPGRPWPLGESERSYPLIDLLIMDNEEACKLSGRATKHEAARFFRDAGVDTCIITHGTAPVVFYASGRLFAPIGLTELPVCRRVAEELRRGERHGDTTGCGDNFVGGVIASIARSLMTDSGAKPRLPDAVGWGIASGGITCFHAGGTYLEAHAGEKLATVREYYESYRRETSDIAALTDEPWSSSAGGGRTGS